MKLEQQVVSLELAKKLKKAGYKQEGLFCWVELHKKWIIWYWKELSLHQVMEARGKESVILPDYITAPTVAELVLPPDFFVHNTGQGFEVVEIHQELLPHSCPLFTMKCFVIADTEADARAKMLVHLKENKL